MIKSNIFQGLTVGIHCLFSSMALTKIVTGVPPQLSLYTAILQEF